MAVYYDTVWYTHSGDMSTTGYFAVAKRVTAAATAISAGAIVRQFTAPAVGSERVFVCIIAGTTANATDATWVLTRGAKTVDGTVTWMECTGAGAVNGDATNTPNWTQAKALGTPNQGCIIKRNSGASYQICTTAGTLGASEPAFSNTPGVTTTETSATTVWTCIGTSFGNWAAPHARLANALVATWGSAGNDFFVADNSAETSAAAITLSIGAVGFPSRLFSVNHATSLPAAQLAGASFTSSLAGNNAILVNNSNSVNAYWYGFTFIATGTATAPMAFVAGSLEQVRFDTCGFLNQNGSATSNILFGSSVSVIDLNNCTIGLSNAAQFVQIGGCIMTIRNAQTPFLSGGIYVIPTTVFKGQTTIPINLLVEGSDLTALGSSTMFFTTQGGGLAVFKNCALHTGLMVAAAYTTTLQVDIVNSDGGAATYRNERYTLLGSTTTSTSVVRTGGASDGPTPVSHLITPSSANSRPHRPFISIPLVIWNDVIGSTRTLTLYGTLVGASQPMLFNDQFWIEIEYIGSIGTPIGTFATTGLVSLLTAHTQNAVADGSTWSGATNTPFSLAITFVAQSKGYVTIYPKAAGATAFYLDPKPVIT